MKPQPEPPFLSITITLPVDHAKTPSMAALYTFIKLKWSTAMIYFAAMGSSLMPPLPKTIRFDIYLWA
jgi:hypothetical protein